MGVRILNKIIEFGRTKAGLSAIIIVVALVVANLYACTLQLKDKTIENRLVQGEEKLLDLEQALYREWDAIIVKKDSAYVELVKEYEPYSAYEGIISFDISEEKKGVFTFPFVVAVKRSGLDKEWNYYKEYSLRFERKGNQYDMTILKETPLS